MKNESPVVAARSHASALTSGARVPALDGIRGLAILLVIMYHHTVMQARTGFDEVFFLFAKNGWCGVDLFFVLSGFLITGILVDAKGGRHYFRHFYARRTLRIFPLYYAVVFFSFFVLPTIAADSDLARMGREAMANRSQAWYWLYLSNFVIASDGQFLHPILSLSWSLAIEEQFYLAWPAVVLLLGRRSLMRLCAALILGALAFRTALVLAGTNPFAIYTLTISRLDALAVGAFIALALRSATGLQRFVLAARVVAPLSAASVAFIIIRTKARMFDGPAMQSAGFTLLALFFGSLLVLTLTADEGALLSRCFRHPLLRTFGKYSYALYLFHVPVRRVVRDSFYGAAQFPTLLDSQLPGQLLFYIVATAPAMLLAWLSWHLYEKQILKLKRFFPYDRPATIGTPAASDGRQVRKPQTARTAR